MLGGIADPFVCAVSFMKWRWKRPLSFHAFVTLTVATARMVGTCPPIYTMSDDREKFPFCCPHTSTGNILQLRNALGVETRGW